MSNDRIVINISRDGFTDAVLSALERDTGVVPIVPEILRIIKIKQRREELRATRLRNLDLARQIKTPHVKPNMTSPRKTWWQRFFCK